MKISHGLYSIEINEQNGRLLSLSDGRKEFVKKSLPMFGMALRDRDGNERRYISDSAKNVEMKKNDFGFTLRFVMGENLTVTVRAETDDEIRWFLQVSNRTDKAIEWIGCPGFCVPDDLTGNGGKSKILWGFNEGVIIEDMQYREHGFGYRQPSYPGEGIMPIYPGIVQMQCMAYYDGKSGLYMGTHDAKGNVKSFDFFSYNDAIGIDIRQFTGCDFGEDYCAEYPFVLKFFEGEWQNAAEIYRSWFDKNKASDFKKIADNEKLPDWYGQAPVVVTYPIRGKHDMDIMNPNKLFPYKNALPYIEKLQKELDSKIMVLLMHWEGTAPWAPPYIWPPYGSEKSFTEFVDALHASGNLLGVYCSGIGWTEQSLLVPEYNRHEDYIRYGMEKEMCASPAQIVEKSHICSCIRDGYDFCPTSESLYKILNKEISAVVASGVDYIQVMDQNHGGNSYFCYSQKHTHKPMPGKEQTAATKRLLDRLSESTGASERKVPMGCESAAGEYYIPELLFSDNRFNLCYNIGRPVPMYAYLYHEYVNNFSGNGVSTANFLNCKKSPESLCMRLAHSFIAGDAATLVLDENGNIIWNWGWREYDDIPNNENVLRLVRSTNFFRKKYPEYLERGRMVMSFPIECAVHTVYQRENYPVSYDDIFTSAFENDGKTAQFLVNYTTEPKVCTVRMGKIKKYTVISAGEREEGMGDKIVREIPPLSAVMIEFESEKQNA